MKTCLYCGFYQPVKDEKIGACHGAPPNIMLLPAPVPKATMIQSGGQAQAFALQTVRPTVQQGDCACRFFKDGTIN